MANAEINPKARCADLRIDFVAKVFDDSCHVLFKWAVKEALRLCLFRELSRLRKLKELFQYFRAAFRCP